MPVFSMALWDTHLQKESEDAQNKKHYCSPSIKISSTIEDWQEAYSINLKNKQIIQIKEGISLTSDLLVFLLDTAALLPGANSN